MIIFKYSKDLRRHLDESEQDGIKIGFVPTMGALHDGHLSLISQSKKETNINVCSIYVNPVQFNNPEDFEKYPVHTEGDIFRLESQECDIIFLPDSKEIYPDELSKKKRFDIGHLEHILEGKFRPGHFQGVCLVVEKLLDIIRPTQLYLGQKDYQQSLVISRLVSLLGTNIEIIICPTIREPSGLAMSSRNLRLSGKEKEIAPRLFGELVKINRQLRPGNLEKCKEQASRNLEDIGFKIDYLEVAKQDTLETVNDIRDRDGLIILVAAFLNDIRLIDNLPVSH